MNNKMIKFFIGVWNSFNSVPAIKIEQIGIVYIRFQYSFVGSRIYPLSVGLYIIHLQSSSSFTNKIGVFYFFAVKIQNHNSETTGKISFILHKSNVVDGFVAGN